MADDFAIIEITGASADILGARDIDGLTIHDHGDRSIGADRFIVVANATDEAIAELRARGLTVNVVYSAEDMAAHFQSLDSESDPEGVA